MLKRLVRLALALIILSGSIAIAVVMTRQDNGAVEESAAAPAPDVSALSVQRQVVAPEARWAGRVVASQRTELTAPVDLTVDALHYREGQQVSAGEAILDVDLTEAERELALVEAEATELALGAQQRRVQQQVDEALLEMERALLDQAERALQRERGLRERGVTTASAVDQAQSQVIQARQAVRQREAALQQLPIDEALDEMREERLQINLQRAEERLQRSRMQAPFAGIIDQVSVSAGQRVSAGQPVFSIYDPGQLHWQVNLPRSAPPEMRARLADDWIDMARRSGSVPDGNSNRSGLFPVPEQLGWAPGEIHEVRVRWPAREQVQLLPGTALYSGNRVFLIDEDDRLVAQAVTLLGTTWIDGEEYWLADGRDLPDEGRILITRLPNALNGQRVAVSDVVDVSAEPRAE